MRELSLHLLDIVENSISAKSKNILIEVIEDTNTDKLRMSVLDDGVGMDSDMVTKITDPFVTSRTTRKVGLGIPLLKAAAEGCNGSFSINSTPGKGTRIDVVFQLSHIDRMPLGNISDTISSLVIGSPEVHWVFRYKINDMEFEFDDAPIKHELEGVSLTEPPVITFIRHYIEDGIRDIKSN